LRNSKRSIQLICKLSSHFVKLGKTHNNFEHLHAALKKKNFPEDSPLMKFLHENITPIKHIINLRNKDEHSNDKIRTIIKDFALLPGRKISEPCWHLSNSEPVPIKDEMEHMLKYLIGLAEIMLIRLVMTFLKKNIPYILIEKPTQDANLPIKYELTMDIDLGKLKMNKKGE